MKRGLCALACVSAMTLGGCRMADTSASGWQKDFGVAKRSLSPTGRSAFFILEPGYQCAYEGGGEKLVITVLDDTETVAGVTTRVVEEREWKNGKLAEVSRNYFAICAETSDVFYFGEDVDIYKNDKVVGHESAWRAGRDAAEPGLIMPGSPKLGMKYYQELAPGVAMDRAEVVGLDAALKTPAGTFATCLKTREGSALKPAEKEYKLYAPGVGLIQDGDLLLTKYGFARR